MKKIIFLLLAALMLAGCGSSVYGRSGPGGGVGGSRPVAVWAVPGE